jgi:peptidoglycan/xylan/chitin deacetylase (PgdA/CDA1 family)
MKEFLKSIFYDLYNTFHHFGSVKDEFRLVLNYHHIVPHEQMERNLLFGYSHSTSAFESQLRWLHKAFGPFQNLEEGGLTLTFDDCSMHTYEQVTPLLDKYGIEAHFFVAESSIGGIMWIDEYFLWLSYVPTGTYNVLDTEIKISNDRSRLNAHSFLWSRLVSGLNKESILKALNEAYNFNRFETRKEQLKKRLCVINKIQIADLISRGHRVGFHSKSHTLMSRISGDELASELVIEEAQLFNSQAFAIPFGDRSAYNPQVIEKIKLAGFHPILLNHAELFSSELIGRLNLPNTSSENEVRYHIQRYLKNCK